MLNPISIAAAVTSPAAASTAVGPTVDTLDGDFAAHVFFTAQLLGATGGTLDVYLQDSVDGTTWIDLVHFAQLAAGAAAVNAVYVPALSNAIVTPIGIGTLAAPGVALAAASVRGGHPQRYVRYVFVAGAGTSAGAAQTLALVGHLPLS